jgi:restriction system protein
MHRQLIVPAVHVHNTFALQAANTAIIQNANAQRQRFVALLTEPRSVAGILLQAVVIPGDKTTNGQIIEAVAWPWFEIVKLFANDPNAVYQIDWRKWEEIIAGAYKQRGFEVVLTPRSNDKGRDIIASLNGLNIRYFDQVKAYKPGNRVTLADVDAMLGVLSRGQNVSKGVVTTTSDFAPGVYANDEIKRLMPYRLELKARDQLLKELSELAGIEHHKHGLVR